MVILKDRTHRYLLLTMARLRLADANRGIDSASQGSVELELLSRMLGLDSSHLNIQIYRMRSQLAKALDAGIFPPHIIERRRREVRFGTFEFHIVRSASFKEGYDSARKLQNQEYRTALSA